MELATLRTRPRSPEAVAQLLRSHGCPEHIVRKTRDRERAKRNAALRERIERDIARIERGPR